MEIDVHVVNIHLETKEDQLQINSYYILIKDIEIIEIKFNCCLLLLRSKYSKKNNV